MRESSVHQHSALYIVLAVANLYLPLFIYFHGCRGTHNLHSQLERTVLSLRPSDTPTGGNVVADVHRTHQYLRKLCSALQKCRQCTLRNSRDMRRSAEFALISSTLDGVLLYLVAVIPPSERVALEIGGDSLAAAPLAIFQGFRVVALSETWRSYDRARGFYAQNAYNMRRMATASGMAVEAGQVEGRLRNLTREVKVGRADVVVNFAGWGENFGMLKEIGGLGAKLVVMKYADWLGEGRLVVKGGIGGVVAMVESMERVGYRLVWCLSTQAVGILVRSEMGSGLRTLSAKGCLRERNGGISWRRDMEAVWDETVQKGWREFR